MEHNELKTWLDNNQLNNKKVRNNKIVSLLDQFLLLRDKEKVDLIISYYDKDYFKENNMGPKIENIAQYCVMNFPQIIKDYNVKKDFQNQIRSLLDIAPEPQPNWFHNMKTKYEALFADCALQLAESNENKKQLFVRFFTRTFPETPENPDMGHIKEEDFKLVQTPAKSIIESAVQNNFEYESFMELKKSGFGLYESHGLLIKKSMFSNFNPYDMSYPGKKILDLFIQQGNEVNTLSLISAVQNSKTHDILRTLISHYSDHENINKPVYINNNQKTNLFNSLIKSRDFNRLNDIQPFIDEGMFVDFDKKSMVVSMLENQKNTRFIDDLLSIPQKNPYEQTPSTDSMTDFDQFITGIIQSNYSHPEIVEILEKNNILSNPLFENSEKSYVQSKIKKWQQELKNTKGVNDTGQAIIRKLESQLKNNKKPTIFEHIKDFKNKKKTNKLKSI